MNFDRGINNPSSPLAGQEEKSTFWRRVSRAKRWIFQVGGRKAGHPPLAKFKG
jgi:hypothetical protein